MPTLYSVNVRWVKTPPEPQKIDAALDRCGDWLRFDGYSWLVASEYTAFAIGEFVRKFIDADDSLLVIKCDPADYGGWAQKWVWDWINKYRSPSSSGLGGVNVQGLSAIGAPPSKR